MVGVVHEEEQVAEADERVGPVARAGERVGLAVDVADDVDSHDEMITAALPSTARVTERCPARRAGKVSETLIASFSIPMTLWTTLRITPG